VNTPGSHGEDLLVPVRNAAGDQAAVSLYGGQLLSWRPAGEDEQIYCSPLSHPAAGHSVRGGAPICFPQFSDRGPLPKHGFARNRRWQLVTPPAPHAQVAEARFQLDSAMTSTLWDQAFCLVLVVRLGPGWLELHLQAANTGRTAYAFTGAIHTYLALQDVRMARVLGLQGRQYEDQVRADALHTQAEAALTVAGEVDRMYRSVPGPLQLEGGGLPARRIVQQGFDDAVIWNPGPDKAARLGDMPRDDWLRMLCVEAAVVHRPVTLAPGKTWRGMQRLELPDSPGFDPAHASD
jgi:glucose-6-phosphate 1-epimerase